VRRGLIWDNEPGTGRGQRHAECVPTFVATRVLNPVSTTLENEIVASARPQIRALPTIPRSGVQGRGLVVQRVPRDRVHAMPGADGHGRLLRQFDQRLQFANGASSRRSNSARS
jgi:hypothetical protein